MKQAHRKRVTLRDVAERAGVSTAVVSYAIHNGPRPISEETRARVLQAIEDLGYHPNASAQAMSTQRTRTIGFVIQDVNEQDVFVEPYVSRLLASIATTLKAQRHYLIVYLLNVDEPLADLRELLQSRRLDGVIMRLVQDTPQSDALLQTVADAHLPCVCIERPGAARFGFPALTYGDKQAAYAATQALIAQGHQRIAHLQGDLRSAAGHDRREGYRQALADARLAIDETLIVGNSWAAAAGMEATQRLLGRDEVPTAIFAANDYLAIGAMTVLRQRGLRVPGDVAVIGYDDIPLAAEADPALTTVHVPLPEIGSRAATLMLEALETTTPQEATEEVLPAQLVQRSSA